MSSLSEAFAHIRDTDSYRVVSAEATAAAAAAAASAAAPITTPSSTAGAGQQAASAGGGAAASASAPLPVAASVTRKPPGRRAAPAGATVFVSPRQKGNPMLRFVRNVTWHFRDIVPDFEVGEGGAVLFLSIKFHLRSPGYIFSRMKALRDDYRLRLVLLLVDVEDNVKPLRELTDATARSGFTLVLAWSEQEAARYLETLKLYESKSAAAIKERVEATQVDQLVDVLTSVRSVNKPDALAAVSAFGSLADVMRASADELTVVPGFGTTKAQRLEAALHAPLRPTAGRRPR